jgi:aminopeptidase
MADPRHQKLAQVLVHYSLKLQPKEKLLITAHHGAALLVREVYRLALHAGAYPAVRIQLTSAPFSDCLADIRLREGSEEQLRYLSEIDQHEVEYFDAFLGIQANENTKNLSGIDPQRIAMLAQTQAPLEQRLLERTAAGEVRWCVTLFPTQAHAQDAAMSFSDYEDFVFAAGLLNEVDPAAAWQQLAQSQQHIADFLTRHDEIHILAPDTDITYRVGGRKWLNADGHVNFPDGEVFSAPLEDSVNGTVRFSFPADYAGQEVEDIRLLFRSGRVVEASAARGQDLLLALLDQDAGARSVGEVAFGLNDNIQRFTRNILFDEKIGGTMHLALGNTYLETGGKNQSGLHWDMICDLRQGQVYADGQLCYESGKFTI